MTSHEMSYDIRQGHSLIYEAGIDIWIIKNVSILHCDIW